MPYYDHKQQQILSPLCRQCIDPYFSQRAEHLPAVGCCSYSPVFSLYEVYQILQAGNRAFFYEQIFYNPNNTIHPYEIIIHAWVHPQFNQVKERQQASLSAIELEDIRIHYSVCQFFIENKGCSLPALSKPSTCRSFICSSIENRLDQDQQAQLVEWIKEIQGTAGQFNRTHQALLEQKGWNFSTNVDKVLDYLEQILQLKK